MYACNVYLMFVKTSYYVYFYRLLKINLLKKISFCFMYMSYVLLCLYVHYIYACAYGGQKRALEALELSYR